MKAIKGTILRVFLAVVLVGSITIAAAFCVKDAISAQPPAKWTKPISIASGSIGSLHYTFGTGVAALLTTYLGVNVACEATTWSAANIDLLRKKDVELATVTSDAVYDGWQGKEYFEGKPQKFLRLIHSGYDSGVTLVARTDSGIKTTADLKGKRFYAWHPTSPIIQRWCNLILEANHLNKGNLKLMEIVSTKEAVTALIENRCDAALIAGAPPTAAVVELTNTLPCNIVPIGEPEIQLMKGNYSFIFPLKIPANTYKGQNKEVLTQGCSNTFICREDLPDELVYMVTKALMGNPKGVGAIHPAAKNFVVKNFFYKPQAPFHPGAIKYYKEVGVWNDDAQKFQDQMIGK